jgi:hypothetical protein
MTNASNSSGARWNATGSTHCTRITHHRELTNGAHNFLAYCFISPVQELSNDLRSKMLFKSSTLGRDYVHWVATSDTSSLGKNAPQSCDSLESDVSHIFIVRADQRHQSLQAVLHVSLPVDYDRRQRVPVNCSRKSTCHADARRRTLLHAWCTFTSHKCQPASAVER